MGQPQLGRGRRRHYKSNLLPPGIEPSLEATCHERCPLLAGTLPLVGHAPIRNRGTIGGSLAHVGVAAAVALAADGTCAAARLAVAGAAPAPFRAGQAERGLAGGPLTPACIDEAAAAVARQAEPEPDIHASAAYRREMVRVFAARAIRAAAARAGRAAS